MMKNQSQELSKLIGDMQENMSEKPQGMYPDFLFNVSKAMEKWIRHLKPVLTTSRTSAK